MHLDSSPGSRLASTPRKVAFLVARISLLMGAIATGWEHVGRSCKLASQKMRAPHQRLVYPLVTASMTARGWYGTYCPVAKTTLPEAA